MTTLTALESQYHTGEETVHRLLRLPTRDNPTYHGLAPSYGHRIIRSPLVAFGTLDRQGRPWATIWGGEAGFCRPLARDVLGIHTIADVKYDPVFQELYAVGKTAGDEEDGDKITREVIDDEVVRPDGGKILAGLSIDLETRDRVKIAGRMLAGAATRTEPGGGVADLQMALQIEESLGNCPKYLNKKLITPHIPSPRLISEGTGTPLSREALDLIGKADLFFIASKHGNNGSMDVNHRGGPPGFLRVFRNQGADVTLIYPEYSGNRLYQTLGNLQEDPCAGLAVPDFATGDVLYLTGRTTILTAGADRAAAAYMPRTTKLAVRIDVEEARLVAGGLPFRGEDIDFSPYNPPVRRLACEVPDNPDNPNPLPSGTAEDKTTTTAGGIATATLVRREPVTPSISRYVFRLEHGGGGGGGGGSPEWRPGYHVTLDFGPELDLGWSHMRDDDPQSLNDDYVRTFTVSGVSVGGGGGNATPAPPASKLVLLPDGAEFEIVARRHGPATSLLASWPDLDRVPLAIPVLGFGGGSGGFGMLGSRDGDGDGEEEEEESVFVAGGVGITPLMAQAAGVLLTLEKKKGGRLRVLWSLRGEDIALAGLVLGRIAGLGPVTRVYVTGEASAAKEGIARIRGLGAEVVEGRMGAADVLAKGEGEGKRRRNFYCCAGPGMLRDVLRWTEGEEVAYESFEY
ncbi:hypothetical protein F5X99DRAFT_389539 [Biscogniauxia marginata]|nr:hypothetical protein F5X99DRAFT_389539 [Biscogniauxia marginata]